MNAVMHALYTAGVSNLVTNLWQQDQNQSDLLFDFLTILDSGTKAARAMQQAKLEFLSNNNRNPYYWSDNLVYGPPVEIILRPKKYWGLFSLTAAGVIFLVILIYYKSRQLRQEVQ
jgi:hypothetical protein